MTSQSSEVALCAAQARGPNGRAWGRRQGGFVELATATLQALVVVTVAAAILLLLWSARFAAGTEEPVFEPLDRARREVVSPYQRVRACQLRVGGSPSVSMPAEADLPLRPGKTYVVRLKGGFSAVLAPNERDIEGLPHPAYAFETVTRHTVETNDGERMVARVHFDEARTAKLLSASQRFEVDLGPPGAPLLACLDAVAPTEGIALVEPGLVARALLGPTAQTAARSPTDRAFVETDSLTGKTVRITYRAGEGVESIQPLGCPLSLWEATVLCRTAVLSRGLPLPALPEGAAPEAPCTMDARWLLACLDPAHRGVSQCEVTLRACHEGARQDRRCCTLRIEAALLEVAGGGRSVALVRPSGTLQFNVAAGYVESGRVRWTIDEADFDGSRLLFEAYFREPPVVAVDYSCLVL